MATRPAEKRRLAVPLNSHLNTHCSSSMLTFQAALQLHHDNSPTVMLLWSSHPATMLQADCSLCDQASTATQHAAGELCT
eukprot:scaffold179443_cov15-Tisochrysis_lutea.AAC.1